MFYLFNIIAVIILVLVGGIIGHKGILSRLFSLAVFLPTIAVGVRRMHDNTNHSGWWLFLPIVNFIFLVTAGDQIENRFGPDPKAIAE